MKKKKPIADPFTLETASGDVDADSTVPVRVSKFGVTTDAVLMKHPVSVLSCGEFCM